MLMHCEPYKHNVLSVYFVVEKPFIMPSISVSYMCVGYVSVISLYIKTNSLYNQYITRIKQSSVFFGISSEQFDDG